MDLNNRSFRPNQQVNTNNNPAGSVPQPAHHEPNNPKKLGKTGKFKTNGVLNITYIFLLFSVTVVIVGVLLALIFFKNNSREESYIDTTKYQAIFLNNGQVYFGHITKLNNGYLRMNDIYYLRVNQQVQPDQKAPAQDDVSLVKLGCELHGPQDSMVVNKDQITFWENLKDNGQVAKAVADYKRTNPNGQNCEQQAQTPATDTKDPKTDNGSGATNNNDAGNSNTPATNSTPATTNP